MPSGSLVEQLNKPFKLFPCCIPVQGLKRSIIYDLNRHEFSYIPNDLYTLLVKHKDESMNEIKSKYTSQNQVRISEYFNFLIEKEFLFFGENKEELKRISSIDLYFQCPSSISNAIIQIGDKVRIDIKRLGEQLNKLGCRDLLIAFHSAQTFSSIKEVLQNFENSSFKSIDLAIKYSPRLTSKQLNNILLSYKRIRRISVYEAPSFRIIRPFTLDMHAIIHSPYSIPKHLSIPIQNTSSFRVNVELFCEAQNFNTYLNKKVSIDPEGNIKNAPNSEKSYGNINSEKIDEVISRPDFQSLWKVKKDDIHICRNCEYRYMCVDNRIPVQDNGSWRHKTNCLYNIDQCEWQTIDKT